MSIEERIILGIDPGTTIMGFGLIKVVGKKMEFLQLNELQLSKYDNHYKRLKLIFERTIELIDTFHPDHIICTLNIYLMGSLATHASTILRLSILGFIHTRGSTSFAQFLLSDTCSIS